MNDAKILQLPKFSDPRGNLSYFESNSQIPFDIKRTYWIYDVPGGGVRGLYAFKESNIFVVALSGSFDIVLNKGMNGGEFSLNRSYYGLLIPNMNWLRFENFSTNALALVVSSILYDEDDYIRDFDVFKKMKNEIEE